MKLLKSLPLVAATAAALGIANPAQADVYAVAAVNLTDLLITPSAPITIIASTPSSDASANLNGFAAVSNTATNAIAVNSPANNVLSIRADNVFNQFGQTNASYSNADSVIDSQQTAGAPFTQSRNIGESFISGNANAGAISSNGSVTGFTFSLAGTTSLTFSFNAFAYLQAAIDALDPGVGSTAGATINSSISISQSGVGQVFSWTPDGTGAHATTGGTVTLDPFDLNTGVSAAFPAETSTLATGGCTITAANMAVGTVSTTPGTPGGAVTNPCFAAFSAFTNPLGPGDYSVTIIEGKETDVESVVPRLVPVPGTLALMGLGLLGFGAFGRRRKVS